MDYIFIDSVSGDLTKVIINGVQQNPVADIIYVVNSTYTKYVLDNGVLVLYEDPVFIPYSPNAEFSRLTEDVVITLDNTNGTYNDFLPHGFKTSQYVRNIDFRNGFKIERRFDTDRDGFEHDLYDLTIDRTGKPTVISYI